MIRTASGQRSYGSVVEPWRRCEGPHFEHIHVGWIFSRVEAHFIDLFAACFFPIVFHDTELSEHAAANDDAVVAAAAGGVMNWRSPWRSDSERASAFPA